MKTPKKKRVQSTVFIMPALMLVSVFGACAYEKDNETASAPNASQPVSSTDAPTNFPGFYVDLVNGKPYKFGTVVPVSPEINEVTVNGWGVDQKNKKAAGGVSIVIDGTTEIAASYGEEREDVAKVLKEENYTNSGFTAKAPMAGLAKGKHHLTFKVVSVDKSVVVPDWKIEIDLQ